MTNPATTVIRVNLEMAKEVAQEWERASYQELSAYPFVVTPMRE